jgi:hypothetical protein
MSSSQGDDHTAAAVRALLVRGHRWTAGTYPASIGGQSSTCPADPWPGGMLATTEPPRLPKNRSRLVVLPGQVGDAAGWWLAAECGVAAMVIVVVEPVGEGGDAVGFGGVGVRVGPFVEQGPVEPLHLAVGLWPVGAGPFVADLVAERGGEQLGDVAAAVVGQDPADGDPAAGEVGVGAGPECGRGLFLLVGEDLAVGEREWSSTALWR